MAAKPEDYPQAVQDRLARLRSVTQCSKDDEAERLKLVRTLRTEDGVVAAVVAEASGVSEERVYQTSTPQKKKASVAR